MYLDVTSKDGIVPCMDSCTFAAMSTAEDWVIYSVQNGILLSLLTRKAGSFPV